MHTGLEHRKTGSVFSDSSHVFGGRCHNYDFHRDKKKYKKIAAPVNHRASANDRLAGDATTTMFVATNIVVVAASAAAVIERKVGTPSFSFWNRKERVILYLFQSFLI